MIKAIWVGPPSSSSEAVFLRVKNFYLAFYDTSHFWLGDNKGNGMKISYTKLLGFLNDCFEEKEFHETVEQLKDQENP